MPSTTARSAEPARRARLAGHPTSGERLVTEDTPLLLVSLGEDTSRQLVERISD